MFSNNTISIEITVLRLLCPFIGLLMILSGSAAYAEGPALTSGSQSLASGAAKNAGNDTEKNTGKNTVTYGAKRSSTQSRNCIEALMAPHSHWFSAQELLTQGQSEYALYLKVQYMATPSNEQLQKREEHWDNLWNEQYKLLKVIDSPIEKKYTPSIERILLFLDLSIELNQSPLSLAYETIILKNYCFFNTDSRSTSYFRIGNPGSCLTDDAVIQIIRASRKFNLGIQEVVSLIKELQRRIGPRYIVSEGFFMNWLLFEMDPGVREAQWRGY